MKATASSVAAAFALLACVGVVYQPSLVGTLSLTAHHDNLDGAAPLRIEAARQWKTGHFPLWNPFKRAGMPLLADTTAGAAYPFNLAYVLAAAPARTADGSPAQAPATSALRVMDIVAAVHAALGAVFMFVLLRGLHVDVAAALFGGLLFGCSGTMQWLAAFYIQMQNAAVWLPLVLACVQRAATDDPRRRAWISAGALAVALQWLAGYPEISLYTAILAVLFALALARRGRMLAALGTVAAIYAGGLALAAVQLIPALELQSLSRRPGSLSLEVFQSLPASAWMFTSWVMPAPGSGMEFPPLPAYRFGAIAILAAVAGIGRSRRSLFFCAVLGTGYLLAIGNATPVSGWAWHLPVASAFRHPFKHLVEVSFAIAALAALGMQRLLDRAGRGARWPLAVVGVAVVATTLTLWSGHVLLAIGNPPGVDTSGATPQTAGAIDPESRVLTTRSFFEKRDPSFLLGDYPSQFEVPAVHGAGPYLWSALAEATGLVEEETTLRRGLLDAGDKTLPVLSCGYVVQARRDGAFAPPVDLAFYRTVLETDDVRVLRRPDALPRYRLAADAQCGTAAQIERSLHRADPDPAEVALVSCGDGEEAPTASAPDSSSNVDVLEAVPGRIVLRTTVADRSLVVLSQSDLPGWKARVGGAPARIWRVDGLVQGVEVPEGRSIVELVYEPASFAIGAMISVAAALFLALLGLRRGAPAPLRREARGS